MGHLAKHVLEDRLQHPVHRTALAYWHSHRLSARDVPARQDIDPLDIPDLLPWINLIEVHQHDDGFAFRHRLIGTAIVEMWNRDSTGVWFHELYDPARLARIRPALTDVVTNAQPGLVLDDLGEVGKPHWKLTSLVLPLASDRRQVDMLMAVSQYD